MWDGGNNDWPFYVSDLEIVALDPHRPGHERAYYPGEVNFLRADVLVINKVNTAAAERRRRPHRCSGDLQPRRQARPDRQRDHRRRPGRPRGQARAGGRGRPDGDPRRHAATARQRSPPGPPERPSSSTPGPTRSARWPTPTPPTRTWTRCCPRWATRRSSLPTSRPRSTRRRADVVAIGTPIDLGRLIEIRPPVSARHLPGRRHLGPYARLRHRRVLREARDRELSGEGAAASRFDGSSGGEPGRPSA